MLGFKLKTFFELFYSSCNISSKAEFAPFNKIEVWIPALN